MVSGDAAATIRSNEIVGNEGLDGSGGIGVDFGSVVTISNNLIQSNEGDLGGGMRVSYSSVATVYLNTILYGNDNGGINVYRTGATVTSDHNDFWNNAWLSDVPTGTGDIEADPLFVDASNGDYHLQSESPCMDAPVPVRRS